MSVNKNPNEKFEEEIQKLYKDKRRKYLKLDKDTIYVKRIDPVGNMTSFRTTQKALDDFKRYQGKMRKIMNGMTEQQRKLLKSTNSNLFSLTNAKPENFSSDQAIRSYITRMKDTNKKFRNTKSGTKSEKLFNYAMNDYKKNKLENIYKMYSLDLRGLSEEEQQAKKQLEQYFKNTPMDELLKQVEEGDELLKMVWGNSPKQGSQGYAIDEDEVSFTKFVSLMTSSKTTKKKAKSRINQKKR